MKRFMKNCGISALVLIVIGVTLGMAGRSVAGQATIRDVVENVTGGKIRMDGGNWWGWSIVTNKIYDYGIPSRNADECVAESRVYQEQIYSVEDGGVVEEALYHGYIPKELEASLQEGYDINSAFDFDAYYDILKGDVAKYRIGTNIQNLDIEVGGGTFITRISDDNNIYLEAEDVHKFQGFVEDDTLYIKSVNPINVWDNTECGVILYLPEDYYFQEVEIELGAGELEFSNLNAGAAFLDVGAGSIELENPRVQELNVNVGAGVTQITGMEVEGLYVEVGMGDFTAGGDILSYADVECSMGNVELSLAGSERDFNYYLESSMGNVEVENSGYISNGYAQERTINNGASKDMNIECSMGNITVWFMD